MTRTLFSALGLTFGLGLAGCTQVYNVKVDAMQNKDVQPGHSYQVVAKDAGRASTDPNYDRAVRMVGRALQGHGMYEAENPDTAEVLVEVAYDVGARRVVVQTEPSIEERVPAFVRHRDVLRDAAGRPVAMIDGSPGELVARSLYEKTLTIVAREGPGAEKQGDDAPARELWRVEVRVDDEKDSVDKVLPVMVGAAVDHIGTDSARQTKRLTDDSEPVDFVTTGS